MVRPPVAKGARRSENSGDVIARRSQVISGFKWEGLIDPEMECPESSARCGDRLDERFFDGLPAHGDGLHEEGLGDSNTDEAVFW